MNLEHKKELARSRAREILADNNTFLALPVDQQKKMYLEVVNEQLQKVDSEGGVSQAMFKQKSSDLLNDDRHEKGFQDGIDGFEDLVDSVDFPQFVEDLLTAVFDANINVMKAQTDDYIRLMKEASSGLAKFIKQIDDTTTFAYLAESEPDRFNISMEEDGEGGEKMALTDPKGDKMDVEDNEVKVKIMDAKIKMAQEHRAALREMVLMGITRLVVEKGEVEAEVAFEFKGKRTVNKADKAMLETTKSKGKTASFNSGWRGRIMGGPSGGATTSKRQTQLSVSSTKSNSEDEMKAKLRGLVKIQFKTDYFKLDNFAQMYQPASDKEKQAALPAGAGS